MRALLTLGVFVAPFLLIGIVAKLWMLRRGVSLADTQDKGHKAQSRFLLGIWRRDD
jgi:hypothetical protein